MAGKKEREALLKAIEEDGADVLAEADDSIKSDREFILEAVKQDGLALDYASEELQQDEELQKIADG